MKRSLGGRALHAVFGPINKRRQWHEPPFPVNLLTLLSVRLGLRDQNLFDTTPVYEAGEEQEPPEPALEGLPDAFLPWHKVGAHQDGDGKLPEGARRRVEGIQRAMEAINR